MVVVAALLGRPQAGQEGSLVGVTGVVDLVAVAGLVAADPAALSAAATTGQVTEAAAVAVAGVVGTGSVAETRAVAVKGLAAVAKVVEVVVEEVAKVGAMGVEVVGVERGVAAEVEEVCSCSILCRCPQHHRSSRSDCT